MADKQQEYDTKKLTNAIRDARYDLEQAQRHLDMLIELERLIEQESPDAYYHAYGYSFMKNKS